MTFGFWLVLFALSFVAMIAAQGVVIEWRSRDWQAMAACVFVLLGAAGAFIILAYRGAP